MPVNEQRSAREAVGVDQFFDEVLGLHARFEAARAAIGAVRDPTDGVQAETAPVFDAFDRLAELAAGHWRDRAMPRARRVLELADAVDSSSV